jgi:uncharacterized LabA/DUF88 family protein
MRKKRNNYAFIDSQNLNLAIRDSGWALDWHKLRIHLYEKYDVTKAFLFLGYMPHNNKLYTSLKKKGYQIIFKKLVGPHTKHVKGNCDAELILHSMIELNSFDQAIIISGDGDFYCLIEYLKLNNKLRAVGVPDHRHYSALLREFSEYHFYISYLKKQLSYKK